MPAALMELIHAFGKAAGDTDSRELQESGKQASGNRLPMNSVKEPATSVKATFSNVGSSGPR
jgi:hypothetical protein